MASIQPGTSGTFKETTAEGRLIEVLCFLQLQESVETKNSTGRNGVTGEFSIEELIFSGTYSLPAEQTIGTDGSLIILASPYLQGTSISAGGSSPTFKSSVLERYVLEVLMYVQGLERTSTKNPQSVNHVTGNYNSDNGLYSGSFNLPITLTIGATGKIEFAAKEYLLT